MRRARDPGHLREVLWTGEGSVRWIPVFEWLGGASLLGIAAVAGAPSDGGTIALGLFGALLLGLGVRSARTVVRDGDRVELRALGRGTQHLSPTHAAGYRTTGSGRHVAIVIYLTDGGVRHELYRLMPLGTGKARKHVARIERALDLRPSPRAQSAADEDRRVLEEAHQAARAQVDSPRSRRLGLWILVGVVVYVLVMSAVIVSQS